MAEYDLVVRDGTIHDGLGGEPFTGSVAISGGRIAAVGTVAGRGREEIDAAGRLITPGFVDIHTHYDGQCTWENRIAPSSGHGVTSVVMGNCGVGFAPCRPHQRDMLVKLMEGVEDIPEAVMAEGLPWNWESFPDYLDALDQRRFDIDIATQLPHSALRVYVMGERAARHEPASGNDLQQMQALTSEAIRAGALGVTTSRNHMHRTRAGELAPSLHSTTEELLALAAGLRDAGAGVFQLIPDVAVDPIEEVPLLRRLAERARRPLSFTLTQISPEQQDSWRAVLVELERMAGEGLEVRAQVSPRPVGILFGLDLSYHTFALHPGFRPIAQLPLAEKVKALRDPALRAKLLAQEAQDPNPVLVQFVQFGPVAYELGDPPNYCPKPEDRIDRRAAALGVTPNELIYDLLLKNDGRTILYAPAANFVGGDFGAIHQMLTHPRTLMGLSDGGAHYGMICDASFPTYLLQHWGRDIEASQRIPLPQVIEALTSAPADAVGLRDRGRLAVGCRADVNVIDLERLHLHAPEMKSDLPAGGHRLHQRADGYVASIVSGQITYRDGIATGALPGRLVRGAQAAAG
jgi:N-acyl-D-aspartate/D-glutamate deacylase